MKDYVFDEGQKELLTRSKLSVKRDNAKDSAEKYCQYLRYYQGKIPPSYSSPTVRRDVEALFSSWCFLVAVSLGKAQDIWKEVKDMIANDTLIRSLRV